VIARDNPDVDDGWLCDRGRYGFEMFGAEERVAEPRLKGGAAADWQAAIASAAEGLQAAGTGKVAAIVGDASNEEGYLVQRIVREALGSPHVDSRVSRGPGREALLRLSRPELSARVRDIDDAGAVLVLGTDPLHSSPILDLRIRKGMRRNGVRLAVATDRPTPLDGGAEAIARYAPGGATTFLRQLAEALRDDTTAAGSSSEHSAPEARSPEGREAVADVLRAAGRVVIVWGERIGREQGAVDALLDVADALGLAGIGGAGLLEVPELANARGLREAGCLPDAGPGLTEAGEGMGTEEIRAGLMAGEIESLVLFGVDPLRDFPDTDAWKSALAAADHIVTFSTFETATTAISEVVFPLETHAEKDGTVTHPDGRLQRVRPSAARPGDIRPNWGVLAELALTLGHDTGISSQPSAFAALAGAVAFYAGIDDAAIGGRGLRWQDGPSSSQAPAPGEAIGADSPDTQRGAPTGNTEKAAAARGVASPESAPIASLTLGTYRDLWTGPITELNPPLRFLAPQQRVEMSIADAERLGLKIGDEVKVAQNGSSLTAKVDVKERIAAGTCFLIEGIEGGNANALLNGGPVDVTIEKVGR
jgi:NADH-quinone oxidoreductase subunit G